MNGRFLLDTNIVIALFEEDPSVQATIKDAEEIFLPSFVLGELYYGAAKSFRKEENIARIDELAHTMSILGADAVTAKEYGDIKNALRMKGRPTPENDIWVAAIARQYDLTLVTRDEHFQEVEGIITEYW